MVVMVTSEESRQGQKGLMAGLRRPHVVSRSGEDRSVKGWSDRASWDVVCRRASGRRRYNATRRLRCLVRRQAMLKILLASGRSLWERGIQRWFAQKLRVSPATACRHVAAVMAMMGERPWTWEDELRAQGISVREAAWALLRPDDEDE